MPLMDHIGELRRRIVQIVVSMLISICVLYSLTPWIVDFLIQPIQDYLPNGLEGLVLTGPFEGFSLKFLIAAFAAVVVCSPLIFWEILAFFLPALKPKERRFVVPTFFIAIALFGMGMTFCYCFGLAPAFEFLIGESSSLGTVFPVASDYLKFIILFLIAFGVAFELPVVVFYLIIFDIISYRKMRANWRYIYIALLVLSAVVTPDASPVTMGILFAALLALYEISLLMARIVLAHKIKRQREAEEDED